MTPQEFPEFRDAQGNVATPFGKIACYEKGEGNVALFVHGLPLCGYQWRDVIDDLADERRCLAPDLMDWSNTRQTGFDVQFVQRLERCHSGHSFYWRSGCVDLMAEEVCRD